MNIGFWSRHHESLCSPVVVCYSHPQNPQIIFFYFWGMTGWQKSLGIWQKFAAPWKSISAREVDPMATDMAYSHAPHRDMESVAQWVRNSYKKWAFYRWFTVKNGWIWWFSIATCLITTIKIQMVNPYETWWFFCSELLKLRRIVMVCESLILVSGFTKKI